MQICQVTIIFWILHFCLATILDIQVSRRSTNSTFIIWSIAHNMAILFMIWASFHCTSLKRKAINPPIFDAVNNHGLIVFILANLMTGAVNLSMNTLEVSKSEAIIVIFCYLCAVGGVALLTEFMYGYYKNSRLKHLHSDMKSKQSW